MRACEICGHRFDDVPGRAVDRCPFDGGALVPVSDPLVGTAIAGRYVIREQLGRGGYGVVYRARHQIIGRDVAIKFLLPELAADPKKRERFLREARVANRIGHEHIIDIQDFGETQDGRVYLVMELLRGRALSEEIHAGALPVRRALDIAVQCVEALVRAHEFDVIHRDIKPDNIYLVTSGARRDFVKLLDFGLARMKGDLRLTARGSVFGTPEYMAPEQARGAEVTASSDLYALGCVLFEMLSGRPPFSGKVADLLLKHLREPAPRLSSRIPSVPPELDDLVARLLAKSPETRPRDAAQLLDELQRISSGVPVVRVSIEPDDLASTFVRTPVPSVLPSARERHVDWEGRLHALRRIAASAHPGGVPSAIVRQLAELEAGVSRLRDVELELARVLREVSDGEGEGRGFQTRVGRALDELARDASRMQRERDGLRAELAGLEQTRRDAEQETRRGLARLRAVSVEELGFEAAAALVEEVGSFAARRREASERLAAGPSSLRQLEHAHDDVLFQIEQLKGRLAATAAMKEGARDDARAQIARLEREQTVLAELSNQRALALSRQLTSIPGFEGSLDALLARPSGPGTR